MKIFSAIKIGDYHQNNCEDHLYIGEYGNDKMVLAVMDGCTTAFESHFASTLVGKILKKICLERRYRDFVEQEAKTLSIEENLKSIMRDLFTELKILKNQLMLDSKELLTTLIIMLIDESNEQGIILVIGDGFVNINGKILEFEQDNAPDYLGFHLSDDFQTFYNSQKHKIEFSKIEDLTISTDGIFTFDKLVTSKDKKDIDVIDFLTIQRTKCENEEMINLKLKILENKFGLKNTDDFSMIRVIK